MADVCRKLNQICYLNTKAIFTENRFFYLKSDVPSVSIQNYVFDRSDKQEYKFNTSHKH